MPSSTDATCKNRLRQRAYELVRVHCAGSISLITALSFKVLPHTRCIGSFRVDGLTVTALSCLQAGLQAKPIQLRIRQGLKPLLKSCVRCHGVTVSGVIRLMSASLYGPVPPEYAHMG